MFLLLPAAGTPEKKEEEQRQQSVSRRQRSEEHAGSILVVFGPASESRLGNERDERERKGRGRLEKINHVWFGHVLPYVLKS